MASEATVLHLQGFSAGDLKLIAQGFGHRPRTGADALSLLVEFPDDQIADAVEVLRSEGRISVAALPVASAGAAPGEDETGIDSAADEAEAVEAGAAPADGKVYLFTAERFAATYNGKHYRCGPAPGDCTPLDPYVAAYARAYFEANGIAYEESD